MFGWRGKILLPSGVRFRRGLVLHPFVGGVGKSLSFALGGAAREIGSGLQFVLFIVFL